MTPTFESALSRLTLDAQQIFHRDQVMAKHLASPGPHSPNEVEQIAQVARELDSLLERLPEHLDSLVACSLVTTYPPAADDSLDDFIRAIETVMPKKAFNVSQESFKEQLDHIRALVPAKRRALSLQMENSTAANQLAGGFRANQLMCGMSGALFTGGMLGLAIPGGQAVAGAAIATGMIFLIGLRCLEP